MTQVIIVLLIVAAIVFAALTESHDAEGLSLFTAMFLFGVLVGKEFP